MNKIQIKILNPDSITQTEQMMVCAARLTQRGQQIKNMDDFIELYNKSYTDATVAAMTELPHPTIQKFGLINVAVVGASRRFLAQITRHQNEVKFMSASCQYSDYSHEADFVIPYEIIGDNAATNHYIKTCEDSFAMYEEAICNGVDHDSAAYMMPQGLRNVLIISATPYQWKHMISQRVCRRNTLETRYVMLLIWDALYKANPLMFERKTTGPFCQRDKCLEGKIACGMPIESLKTPHDILINDFSKIYKEEKR